MHLKVVLIGPVFIVKDNKSYYFDSFGGQPDKYLLTQLSKPIIYHIYKIQDINSRICGNYCFYFFYSNERMNYYDVVLKLVFEYLLFSYKYNYNYIYFK